MKTNIFIFFIILSLNTTIAQENKVFQNKKWAIGYNTSFENYPLLKSDVVAKSKIDAYSTLGESNIDTYENLNPSLLKDFERKRNIGECFGLSLERFFLKKNKISFRFQFNKGDKGEYFYSYSPYIYINRGNEYNIPRRYINYHNYYYSKLFLTIDQKLTFNYNFSFKFFRASMFVGIIRNKYLQEIHSTFKINTNDILVQEKKKINQTYYNYLSGICLKKKLFSKIDLGYYFEVSGAKSPEFYSGNNKNSIKQYYIFNYDNSYTYKVDLYKYVKRNYFLNNTISIIYNF